MLSSERFDAAKREICASGPPSSGDNLLGMEIDCCAFLGDPAYADQDPGLWHDMTVSRSDGGEWLIRGTAYGKPRDADAIAIELRRIWEERLRYSYREAHTIVKQPDQVVLQAVTQVGPQGLWVTAHVRVHLTEP